MRVIIVGCGRVGARVAKMLDPIHHVTVVDAQLVAFDRLPVDFQGDTVLGNVTDDVTLRKAGIEQADALASLTNDDNTNIMIGEVATQIYNVPRVLTRIYDLVRNEMYVELGLRTICPTMVNVEAIERAITLPFNNAQKGQL